MAWAGMRAGAFTQNSWEKWHALPISAQPIGSTNQGSANQRSANWQKWRGTPITAQPITSTIHFSSYISSHPRTWRCTMMLTVLEVMFGQRETYSLLFQFSLALLTVLSVLRSEFEE